jgi:hypothetical protein
VSSTPSPAQLRVELERLILTDLLGPSNPDEVLPGVRTPVREWYLVGTLAPKGTVVDPSRGDDNDLPGDDEGGAPGPDGQPAKMVLFPSSIGFTAAVDTSCAALNVKASWGRYEKVANPDPTATGVFQRLWQRHPAGGLSSVPMVEGDVGPLAPDPGQPEVVVRGRCRRTPNCWLITLFLVNEQPPARQNVDERWLFQVELAVEAADGTPAFVGRDVALPDLTDNGDPELTHLDLLYREKVGFAVGHGVAVHAEGEVLNPYRARSVRTAVVPRAEVAKVEAPGPNDPALDDVERQLLGRVTFDMEELARPRCSRWQTPMTGGLIARMTGSLPSRDLRPTPPALRSSRRGGSPDVCVPGSS